LPFQNKLERLPLTLTFILVLYLQARPLQWSPERDSTLVSSSIACKYQTWVEVNVSGKQSAYYDMAAITVVRSSKGRPWL